MVKINEVARAAGVSISTVSYALSGKRPVSSSTRERIEKAVDELGYSPNAGARMLAGRRTQIFALTEPLRTDTHAPTHMSFVLATAIAARRNDYDILLLTDEQARDGMSRVASSGLVDAILVLDVAPDDDRVALARSIATPTIFIGVPNDRHGLICVDLDFEAAARLAVDTLADAGHRRMALIGQTDIAYVKSNFPPRVLAEVTARAAERGADCVFRSSGSVMPDLVDVVQTALTLVDEGATALLLHTTAEAHAEILDALAERGDLAPGRVSVIAIGASFDTAALPHPVDTIPLVPQESCDLAVALAVRSLENEPPVPGLYLVPPSYVSHGTVTAPA
jgi:DNA-binding LacI/PurR family transcriptional regulator